MSEGSVADERLLPQPGEPQRRRRRRATVIGAVVGAGVLLLAVAAVVTAVLVTRRGGGSREYGVMLDAGSSGTRAYVYSWPHRKANTVPIVNSAEDVGIVQERSLQNGLTSSEVKPGIARINASLVATYLQPLVDWAKTVVPAARVASTPIYLRATAGMRLLPVPEQEQIIAAVRRALAASGFRFDKDDWAKVISGEDEGIYGWVTTSYLTGALFGASGGDVGALDMGGASLQITFVPNDPPLVDKHMITIAASPYTLYTHTFLARGQDLTISRTNEAVVRAAMVNGTAPDVVAQPCYLQGYRERYMAAVDGRNHTLAGSGEAAACEELLKDLLNLTAPCPVAPCSFDGAYQPPLRGKFYAMSGFYYTASFLGVSTRNTTSLKEIRARALQFCSLTWAQAQAQYPDVPSKLLPIYCLTGNYIHAMLVHGFHFNDGDTTTLTFTGDIGGTTLNWALGAMIYEASLLPWG